MVSNYDRIYTEIQIESRRVGEDLGIDPEALANLALAIVDIEDRNRLSRIHAINKQVQALIETTAVADGEERSDRD